MKPEERIGAIESGLEAVRGELAAFRQLVERAIPEMQRDAGERTRLNRERDMRAIGALTIPAKLEWLHGQNEHGRMAFWQLGGLDLAQVIDLLRAASMKLRVDLIVSLPAPMRADIAAHLAPAQPRVEVKLVPGRTQRVDPSQLGRDYTGVALDQYAKHIETEERWRRRLEVDHRLADLVKDGVVAVRPLSEAESKLIEEREQLSKPPAERRQLDPRALDDK